MHYPPAKGELEGLIAAADREGSVQLFGAEVDGWDDTDSDVLHAWAWERSCY